MNYQGYVIYRERVRRNWSQAGLCRGICTVSYLSKIESGKAEPSEEILRLFLERLELKSDPEMEREAAALAERGWELLFSGRNAQLSGLLGETDLERARAVPAWLDLALLCAKKPLDAELEPCMDTRQLALQRILQGRSAEAARLMPNAYTHLTSGIAGYNAGNYSAAVDALQTAYDLAGREGAARLMLEAKLFLGNAYCNMQDLPNMERHYRVAKRLAEDLQDREAMQAIGYNTASAWIEAGRCEDAYAWFSRQEQPTLMELHKQAICCEKTGRREEALEKLRTQAPDLIVTESLDITRDDAPEHLSRLIDKLGGMDIYLHCSGIGKRNTELHPDIEIDTLRTNGEGFVRMVTAAFGYFRAHGGGHLAVISSIAGTKGLGSAPAYSATKRMQNTYIDALAQLAHMEKLNIRFTDIRPGFVATPLLAGDGHYPMLMQVGKVAARIMKVLKRQRRRVVIDRRYAVMVFFWKMIPEWLWERLNIRKND